MKHLTVRSLLLYLVSGLVLLATLGAYGSWLWWMGYHRHEQLMLEQMHMLAPETQQRL